MDEFAWIVDREPSLPCVIAFSMVTISSPRTSPTITRLGSIDMPVLVVVGERDLPDFVRMSEQVAREAKRSRRVTVPATGHFASMESPREVNAALVEFLAGA